MKFINFLMEHKLNTFITIVVIIIMMFAISAIIEVKGKLLQDKAKCNLIWGGEEYIIFEDNFSDFDKAKFYFNESYREGFK